MKGILCTGDELREVSSVGQQHLSDVFNYDIWTKECPVWPNHFLLLNLQPNHHQLFIRCHIVCEQYAIVSV